MNKKQKKILLAIEEALEIKVNEEVIEYLVDNINLISNMPRGYGKTTNILVASLVVAFSSSNKNINIFTLSTHSLKIYSRNYRDILDKIDKDNYTFVSNSNFISIILANNSKIQINKKIEESTYIQNCDYIFIDELYTIKYKRKKTLQDIIQKAKCVKVVTTLRPHCRNVLKLFYKLGFSFKFHKRDFADIPKNYNFIGNKEVLKAELLGEVIP